jgi:hypothetical protein
MGAIKAGRSGKLGSSGPVKPSVASGMGLIAGGGNGVLLADDPAFQEACKVGAAAGSFQGLESGENYLNSVRHASEAC